MPEISIITPSYNSSNYLNETIVSVLNQTFQDWEWLITDDCSTDNSVEILEEQNDPRIKVFKAKKNGGAGHARNISLENATGRFITFLDADDFWESNFLEEMVNFMKSENAELAYSTYSRCDENLSPILGDFEADTIVTFNNLLKTCRLSLLSSISRWIFFILLKILVFGQWFQHYHLALKNVKKQQLLLVLVELLVLILLVL